MSLPVTPAEMAIDAIVWMLQEAHDYATAAGETEFQVGNFMDGYFYANIPTELNEYYNVTKRERQVLHFQVSDQYIVNGQKLIEIESPVGSGSLYANFQGKPTIGYDINYRSFYLHLPENANSGFLWRSKEGNTVINSNSKYQIYFGIYKNIPNYVFTKHLTSNTDDDLIWSDLYVSGSADDSLKGLTITNIKTSTSTTYPPTWLNNVYVPIDPTETYDPVGIYEPIEIFVSEWNESNPEDTINPGSIPDWDEIGQTETDQQETESVCCGCGDTYITVNADGSLTLNNDISGDMPINIDNNADLSLNVNAAAGAFGAGAIVVDPDANVNLNAGAFGAGAFGAGAITGDINLSGDVTFEQSGTITNNYYYQQDPSEPTEEFSIDYNEILSEGELESILNQETYSLSLETVSFTDGYQIDVPELSSVPAGVVGTASSLIDYGANVISDTGLMSIYAPLSIFSIICYILRGCK